MHRRFHMHRACTHACTLAAPRPLKRRAQPAQQQAVPHAVWQQPPRPVRCERALAYVIPRRRLRRCRRLVQQRRHVLNRDGTLFRARDLLPHLRARAGHRARAAYAQQQLLQMTWLGSCQTACSSAESLLAAGCRAPTLLGLLHTRAQSPRATHALTALSGPAYSCCASSLMRSTSASLRARLVAQIGVETGPGFTSTTAMPCDTSSYLQGCVMTRIVLRQLSCAAPRARASTSSSCC